MTDTTDIEKKSLEAHVELCAERYRLLETKLESLEEKVLELHSVISELRNMMQNMATKRNDQVMNWGVGIITVLVGTVGWLASHYFKI
jgi:chromosome segregation ATPase